MFAKGCEVMSTSVKVLEHRADVEALKLADLLVELGVVERKTFTVEIDQAHARLYQPGLV